MKKIEILVLVLSCLMLTACSPEKSTPPPKLFEDQRDALEKAKGVESTVQKQAQDLQQNLEKQ